MHVVFLSCAFPRAPGAGVNAVLARRAHELGRYGTVTAIVPTPWIPPAAGALRPRWEHHRRAPRELDLDGLRVLYPRYLQPPGRWLGAGAPASMAIGLLPLVTRLRRAGRCDVLFAQSTVPEGLCAALLGRWTGAGAACLARGTDVNVVGASTRTGRWLTAWTVRHLGGVAAVAHDLAGSLADLAPTAARATVLYDGIDQLAFSPGDRAAARRALGLAECGAIALYVGRLTAGKGLAVLVEAFSRVVREVSGARLLLLGDGELRQDLAARAAQAGLAAAVHLLGEQPYEDVPMWMRAADLVVLPSEAEGFPNVVREAMACGRPVVATPVGDLPRIVAADSGRLVAVGDPATLADALIAVLRTEWSPQAIRRHVVPMTWERNAAETHHFLCRAMGKACDDLPQGA